MPQKPVFMTSEQLQQIDQRLAMLCGPSTSECNAALPTKKQRQRQSNHFPRRKNVLRFSTGASSNKCNSRLQPLTKSETGESLLTPWPSLDFQDLYKEATGGRVRQHVNPLKSQYQSPTEPPDWSVVYKDSSLPLVVDVGCAAGRFLLELAERLPGHNFLGLDIREPHIDRAMKWVQASSKRGQLHFLFSNATVSLQSLLASYPGALRLATIQFPDPHFKHRHKKRRIVQPQFIEELAHLMPPGGHVFLQSDIESVTAEMRNEFEERGSHRFCLHELHQTLPSVRGEISLSEGEVISTEQEPESGQVSEAWHHSQKPAKFAWQNGGYLPENPLGVLTEREFINVSQGKDVYRVMLIRK